LWTFCGAAGDEAEVERLAAAEVMIAGRVLVRDLNQQVRCVA
jgi:hypothetical protein